VRHSKHYDRNNHEPMRDWDEVTSNLGRSPCAKPLGEGDAALRRRYRLNRPAGSCVAENISSSRSSSSRAGSPYQPLRWVLFASSSPG
jgi:hypothetical protein